MPLNTFANRTSSLPLSELDANFTFVSDSTNLSFLQSGTGAVSRSVQAKERDIVSVFDFMSAAQVSAIQAGTSTNDTALIQLAADRGGKIIVPAGTYQLGTVICSVPCEWVLDVNAVFMQCVAPTAAASRQNLLRFVAGSDGSSVTGGTFDGRRDLWEASYVGYGRTANYVTWEGIYTTYANRVTIKNVHFKRFVTMAMRHAGGDDFTFKDCTISDCGEGFLTSYAARVCVSNIKLDDITNDTTPIFQHGIEIRFLTESTISDVVMTNYAGTSSGLEPVPIGFAPNSCNGCSFSGIHLKTYSGNAVHIGMIWNSMVDCAASNITIKEYESGVNFQSASTGSFTNFIIDANYKNVAGYAREGMWVTNGGVLPVVASGLAGETAANTSSVGLSISNGSCVRNGVGVRCDGSNLDFQAVSCIGNTSDGWQIVDNSAVTNSFGGAVERDNYSVTLVECNARANGGAGLVMLAGDRVRISGGDYLNNGQTAAASYRGGIVINASASEVTNLTIDGATDASDTQNWSQAVGVSYKPAVTDANDRAVVTLLYSQKVDVGQRITLVNAIGGPANTTAWVRDIAEDDVTLQFAAATTLVANSNTIALGTGTAVGTALTIPAGALLTALKMKTWIKHPTLTEYRQIVYVTSNTAAVLDSAFTSDFAAAAVVGILGTVSGITCQQQGFSMDADIVGPIYLGSGCSATGNVTDYSLNYSCWDKFTSGSLFRFDGSTALDTATENTDILTGIPLGYIVRYAKVTVTTNITGLTGASLRMDVMEGSSILVNSIPVWSAALTAGAFSSGGGTHGRAFYTNTGGLRLTFSGGADNIPSAGAVSYQAWLEKVF